MSDKFSFYQQYTVRGNGLSPVGATKLRLDAGVYSIDLDCNGETIYYPQDLQTDQLFIFEDDLSAQIMDEVVRFWDTAKEFESYNFVHKRGFLLFGPQGTGKTSIIHQVIKNVVARDGICFIAGHPRHFENGLKKFRAIEPDRPVVCVFEDIDNLVKIYEEGIYLKLLDGDSQINHVVNIATTNYPEELDKRISARPRRFDTVLRIGMPATNIRRTFLMKKLELTQTTTELETWVKDTEGFSFAALAELVVSVKCLKLKYDDVLRKLRFIEMHKKTLFEQDAIGFVAHD